MDVYGTQITIVTGANLNQLITGGPHIVWHQSVSQCNVIAIAGWAGTMVDKF
jgi:hypothetical protein